MEKTSRQTQFSKPIPCPAAQIYPFWPSIHEFSRFSCKFSIIIKTLSATILLVNIQSSLAAPKFQRIGTKISKIS